MELYLHCAVDGLFQGGLRLGGLGLGGGVHGFPLLFETIHRVATNGFHPAFDSDR